MLAYLQWADMRCSVYVPYSEQQCAVLSNARAKWRTKQNGSGEHIVESDANDKNTGSSLVARVDLNQNGPGDERSQFRSAKMCC